MPNKLHAHSYSRLKHFGLHNALVKNAWGLCLPGTTSRASIASLYSMKPKPFMSLISVISPVP